MSFAQATAQNTNHYHVLGLTQAASDRDIIAAYKHLARVHHPDKGGDAANFRAIKEARDILYDPVKREQYDIALAAARLPPPPRPQTPPPPPCSPLGPKDFARRKMPTRPPPDPSPEYYDRFFGRTKSAASAPSQPESPDSSSAIYESGDESGSAPRKDSHAQSTATMDEYTDYEAQHRAVEAHYMNCDQPVEDCPHCQHVPPRWCKSKISASRLAEQRRKRTMTAWQRRTEESSDGSEDETRGKQPNRESGSEDESASERLAEEMCANGPKFARRKLWAEVLTQHAPGAERGSENAPAKAGPEGERQQGGSGLKRCKAWYPFRSSPALNMYPRRDEAATENLEKMAAELGLASDVW